MQNKVISTTVETRKINPFDTSDILNANLVDDIKQSQSYKDLVAHKLPFQKHLSKTKWTFIPLGVLIIASLTYIKVWGIGSFQPFTELNTIERSLVAAAYFFAFSLITGLILPALMPNKDYDYERQYQIMSALIEENKEVFKSYFNDFIFKKAKSENRVINFDSKGDALTSFCVLTHKSNDTILIEGADVHLIGRYEVDDTPVELKLKLKFNSNLNRLFLTSYDQINQTKTI